MTRTQPLLTLLFFAVPQLVFSFLRRILFGIDLDQLLALGFFSTSFFSSKHDIPLSLFDSYIINSYSCMTATTWNLGDQGKDGILK